MTQSIRLSLLSLPVLVATTAPVANAQMTTAQHEEASPMSHAATTEWNNPEDIALVSRAFNTWTDAVIAKDKATIESFHDDEFRAGLGDRLFNKAEHIEIELLVGNVEMKLLEVHATRRIGNILMVWSQHFIRVDSLPEIPSLGLIGDWGGEASAKQGFTQDEISVWRFEGGRLKCLAFAASRKPPP
jgi:hypothetical protein